MRKTTGHGYETCGRRPKRSQLYETNAQRAREAKAWREFQAKHGGTDAKERHYARGRRARLRQRWPLWNEYEAGSDEAE